MRLPWLTQEPPTTFETWVTSFRYEFYGRIPPALFHRLELQKAAGDVDSIFLTVVCGIQEIDEHIFSLSMDKPAVEAIEKEIIPWLKQHGLPI